MSTLLTVLLVVAAAVVVAVVLGVGGALLLRLGVSSASSERPVLPSHYASLLQSDPGNYPGYCTECGTANDPEFEVCRNCSSRLPTRRRVDPERDLERVFGRDE